MDNHAVPASPANSRAGVSRSAESAPLGAVPHVDGGIIPDAAATMSKALSFSRSVALIALLGAVVVAATELSAQVLTPQQEESQASRAITSTDLLELRDIGSNNRGRFSISPDGGAIAYQIQHADMLTRDYRLSWFVAPTATPGEPVFVGDGGDVRLYRAADGRLSGSRMVIEPRWSPDSQWIAYPVKKDGAVQLWRSHRGGGHQEQLTRNAADVRSFVWSSDGASIFFQVGRDRVVRARTDQSEGDRGFLFDQRFWPYFATEPQWFECQKHPWGIPKPKSQVCEPTLWVYDFAAGVERQARPEEVQEYGQLTSADRPQRVSEERVISAIRWDETKSRVLWLENERPGLYAGYRPPLTVYASASAETRCPADECHGLIETIGWSRDKATAYFLRREGSAFSRRAIYGWTVGDTDVRRVLATDDLLSGCQISDDHVICLHESARTPRKIVSISLEDGTKDDLVDPNPQFHDIRLGEVEKLEWQDAFGNDVFGHLVYPLNYEAGRRYPLVIVQYRSRGFLRGGVGDEYPIHVLAANGFAVLSFDRPNDWSVVAKAKGFSEFEAKEWADFYERRRALTALEIILDDLDQRGIIDPGSVGITGLSDGAETVNFALIHSDRFAAAAASDSFWSPVVYHMVGSWFRQHLQNMLGAPEGAGLSNWRQISVGMNADKVNTPLLIQVADHELLTSTHNFYALRDAGKPVEMYVFPDEYHIKWQPQHRLSIYRRNVQWMKFWLQSMEDPDPVDPEQYLRWRKLREQHQANQQALGQARSFEFERPGTTATAELGGE